MSELNRHSLLETMPTASHAGALLRNWLSHQLDAASFQWLETQCQGSSLAVSKFKLFTAFSAVSRYVGKQELQLGQEDLEAVAAVLPGWSPQYWSWREAARSLLLLSWVGEDCQAYWHAVEQLFASADVGELVALYQTLPLLPDPERYYLRAAEGVRSNMSAVFNAVALHNPYPASYFDDLAWNQMVLKALFVGSPLHAIYRLDERANPQLAQMLVDYARERRAAGREVSPELWRATGSFCDSAFVEDLERSFGDDKPEQRAAAALACSASSSPQVQQLLDRHLDLKAAIASGRLSWSSVTV